MIKWNCLDCTGLQGHMLYGYCPECFKAKMVLFILEEGFESVCRDWDLDPVTLLSRAHLFYTQSQEAQ